MAFRGCRAKKTDVAGYGDNSDSYIQFSDVDLDTDNFADIAGRPDYLLVPAGLAGVYIIWAQLGWDTTLAHESTVSVKVLRGNTWITMATQTIANAAVTGDECVTQVNTVCRLEAGDYVYLQMKQKSGALRNINVTAGKQPTMALVYVGP